MPNEKDAEIKSRYEEYSVEELRAALDSIFDSTDEFSDSNVEQMDEIMAVLDKKDPLSQRYTAEESWKHFQENYREELSRLGVRTTGEVMEKESEKAGEVDTAVVVPVIRARRTITEPTDAEAKHGRSSRKLLRAALFAAAVVALMVVVTVSAAAAGINIWGWVPVLNGGTFQYTTADSISQDIPKALKQAGIDKPMYPTWLPDGFKLEEQHISLEEPITINSVYLFKSFVLTISIKEIVDLSQSGLIEVNSSDYQTYLSHGVRHDIITNNSLLVATWYVDNLLIRISGEITPDEMERIIDSVYEVE